jgi:hypothetical protein
MTNQASPVAAPIPCKRCGGGGHIARYQHVAGGRCFGCGRVFGAMVVTASQERAETIRTIADCLAIAGREGLAAELEPGVTVGARLHATLGIAPADVAARGRAALAALAA